MESPAREAVFKALRHEPVSPLPRGEPFISQRFLDTYWSLWSGDYVTQLEAASDALGLQAVGADMNMPEAGRLLHEKAYAKLSRFYSMAVFNGPVARLVIYMGFERAMVALKKYPDFLEKAALPLLDDVQQTVDSIRDNGFSAVMIADDVAGNHGLWCSRDLFEELILPWYLRLVEAVNARGLHVFFHSDGNTGEIIEPLIACGFDCLHPVDAQAGMDIYDLEATCASRICLMGHIDTMEWNAFRVRTEVDKTEKTFAGGGLILGTCCGVAPETEYGLSGLYPAWKPGDKN
jgi:uroporphyrinogen-III decarboxylase